MRITVTDYLEVVSSWCFWSEPTWREQEQWFYRRSGMMMRSPFMLNTDWYDPSLPEWLPPNCVAEAAKDFGFTDDRVRLALAHAALREGKKVADWSVAVEVGAAAGNLEKKK